MFPGAFMAAVLARLNAAEQAAAASYDYSEARAEVSKLRAAVNAAMQQDQSDATGFWTEMGRLGRHTLNYFNEKARFENEANQLKNQALQALQRVEEFIEKYVGKHAPVPAKLVADARIWERNAKRVRELQASAGRLTTIDGWTGTAREQYSAAATVQVNALSELTGIMESTSSGARAGAMLNRAIFYVVGKAVRLSTGRIQGAPGGSGGQYYTRTAMARNECYALLTEVAQAITGNVAGGSSSTLSSELANTISMPNLLEVGSWPTGTSAVGQSPANTGGGVTPDGDDPNLNTGGRNNGGGTGVDL